MFAISGGCSFFYDLNTTQCEVTSDCAGLGIENARCENRVCVPNDSSGGTAGDSGRGGDAGDAGRGGATQGGGGSSGSSGRGGAGGTSSGTGGDAGGGGSPECTTNGDCIDAYVDQPYICKSGSCVAVTTGSCRQLLPTGSLDYLRSDGVILVGGFANFVNQSDPHDTHAVINWDLAFSEFNEATLDGMLLDSRNPRPIVAVVCDGLDADVTPSVEHLVQNLEVPAIISTLPADKLYGAYQTTEQLAEDSAPPVFFMSTGSADLRLANLDDNGLVWHMLGDPRLLAETTAQLLLHVEPVVNEVRQQNFMATGEDDPMNVPLRVALVSSNQTTLNDIATVLTTTSSQFPERTLTFNGKTAAENGTDFRWIEIEPQQANPNLPDTAAVLGALQANPPHVIVAMATEEFVTGVLGSLERNWGTGTAPATADLPRPHYILSHLLYNREPLTVAVGALSDISPPIESRLLGVNYALASDPRAQRLYTDYLLRLQSSYDPMGALYSSLPGTENYYDGAYSLLYSIAAAERFRPTPDGLNVRDALEQRVFSTAGSAEDIDIGPGEIASVVQNGTTISLYGTMGPPDFDRLSGTRVNPTSAWCVQETTSSTFAFQADALLYDRENNAFDEPTGGPPDCAAGY